jgi:hypothetical protein
VGDGVIVFSTVGAGGGAATVGGGGGGALVVDTVTLTSVGVMMVSLWFNHHLVKTFWGRRDQQLTAAELGERPAEF